MWEGLIAGFAVAGFNGLGAWWSIRWSWEKDFQTFSVVFIGGMVIRILLVGGVSVLLLKFAPISKGPFTGGLIFSIILFLVLEITWLLKRVKAENLRSAEKNGEKQD